MDPKSEQLLYAFIGGALSLKEKLENQREEMQDVHRNNQESARAFVEDLAKRGEEEKEAFRNSLKEMLQELAAEIGLATRADIDELKALLEKK